MGQTVLCIAIRGTRQWFNREMSLVHGWGWDKGVLDLAPMGSLELITQYSGMPITAVKASGLKLNMVGELIPRKLGNATNKVFYISPLDSNSPAYHQAALGYRNGSGSLMVSLPSSKE